MHASRIVGTLTLLALTRVCIFVGTGSSFQCKGISGIVLVLGSRKTAFSVMLLKYNRFSCDCCTCWLCLTGRFRLKYWMNDHSFGLCSVKHYPSPSLPLSIITPLHHYPLHHYPSPSLPLSIITPLHHYPSPTLPLSIITPLHHYPSPSLPLSNITLSIITPLQHYPSPTLPLSIITPLHHYPSPSLPLSNITPLQQSSDSN